MITPEKRETVKTSNKKKKSANNLLPYSFCKISSLLQKMH
jgi:hypothetical protein